MGLPAAFRVFSVLVLLTAGSASAGEIKISYPSEGDTLPSVRNTFIFGNVSPSTAPFYINGVRVNVYRNGGFIAYLPVSEGDFTFKCELMAGATVAYSRKVRIRQSPRTAPPGVLRIELLAPSEDIALPPGEDVAVLAEGTPGKAAVFSIKGLVKDVAMTELPAGSGRYFGSYRIKDSDSARGAPLTVKFRSGLFASAARSQAKVRVSVADKGTVVETSSDTVMLRNGIGSGYMMFLPKGVRLVADARIGGTRRIRLSSSEVGWVDDSKVVVSTETAFIFPNETGTIRLKATDAGTSASISMPYPAAYTAEERENSLRLVFYYAQQHTNWVIYDSSDTFIRQVRFSQVGENTVAMDFEFAPGFRPGGYDVYPGTRAMIVDFKKLPAVSGVWPRPLAGLRVVVDPGHSPKYTPPFDGAVGPMGTFEFQVNLMTGHKLRDALTSLGATVYLTRSGDENIPLLDRPRLAREFKGDIFISLHNNAIGDGEDPFSQPRGFSVYHYHRHSLELAAAVHREYVKRIQLPDEGLRYGDYAVARMTSMPAILVESAYMILPEQEEFLNTPAFQQKLADAVAAGVLGFFKVPPPPAPAKKRKK
jgi:N-acetylmuramoyl-L-alanine amidase